jgi:ABC-2 type transport system permease protein
VTRHGDKLLPALAHGARHGRAAHLRDGSIHNRGKLVQREQVRHLGKRTRERDAKLLFTIGVGGLTAFLCVGGFAFRWEVLPLYLLVYLVTASLNFVFTAPIGLAAFWMEDVAGLFFILDRLKWILGGLLLPIEVYPGKMRAIAEALPFQHMIAGPARLFVKFAWPDFARLMQSQVLWLVIFGAICAGVYRLGVRRVDVNGG